jgi:glycosyltransferase involved in cell wall biosynthesis
MRDNALALALRRQGHDVLLLQLYLPLVLDDPPDTAAPQDHQPSTLNSREPTARGRDPASTPVPALGAGGRVFFGGVNSYLQQKWPLFRHTPRWIDRALDHPLLLRLAGRRVGMTDAHFLGEMTLSMLAGEEGNQKKEADKLVDWLRAHDPGFDLISLSNALLVGMVRRLKREIKAPVVCSLQGEDSFLDGLPDSYRQRAWALLRDRAAEVDAFVAPSAYYAKIMADRMGIDPARVHVAHNGIDLAGYQPTLTPSGPAAIGYLARMCPAKGLHTLVEAFIQLKHRGRVPGLRLLVAGAQTPADVPYVKQLQRRLADAGVAQDAVFSPNIDRQAKLDFLRTLSVLSVPAAYSEVFGLYLLEAWAMGVPVVQPAHGAFPELIEATGGGLLYRPDAPSALVETLETLLLDGAQRQALGLSGRAAVVGHFTADQMAQRVARVFEQTVSRVKGAGPGQAD